MKSSRLISLLVCVAAATAVASAAGSESAKGATAATETYTTEGQPVNTYFRKQEELTTSDATEEAVPGLQPTDYKKIWRAIPTLEHTSPFLDPFLPMMPTFSAITRALKINFPLAWPLAGDTSSDKKGWLGVYTRNFAMAMIGKGPTPPAHATVLIPTAEAYHKLAQDMHAYSGVLNKTSVHDPAKAAVLAAAVYSQLLTNLFVSAAPNLATAVNGSVLLTHGNTKLTLLVKSDGSRYLVSNTTTSKLIAMDMGCHACGEVTFNFVDNFVVPKMSPTPPKPEPLFTASDVAGWPHYWKQVAFDVRAMPKAARDMPVAVWGMLARQLPQDQQDTLKQLGKVLHPKLPLGLSIRVAARSGKSQP